MEIKDIEIEEIVDEEWEDKMQKMLDYMEQTDLEQKYLKLYSKFSNFPLSIKKGIMINAIILLGVIVTVLLCIFQLHYKSALLFAVTGVLVLYLGWKIIITFFYLRHAHFITFTGRIVESFSVGTKLTNDKHFVIKLLSDDGKEISFPYYDKHDLNFDQYITLFINNDSEIIPSQYGPYIEKYIEAIPSDEIESRMRLMEQKEKGALNIRNYLDK